MKKSASVSSISTGVGSPNHPNHPLTPVHVQVSREGRNTMPEYLSPGASPFKGASTAEPLSFGLSLSLSLLEGQQEAPQQQEAPHTLESPKKHFGQQKQTPKRNSATRKSFGMNGAERNSVGMYEPDEADETWDPNAEKTPCQPNRRRWASITDGDASPAAWPAWSPTTGLHGSFRRSTLQQQGQQQQQQMQNQQLQMQQQLEAASGRTGNTSPPLSPTMTAASTPGFAPSSPFGQSMYPGAQMQMVPGMQAPQIPTPMPNNMQPFHPHMTAMQGGMPYPYAALAPYAQMPYAAMHYSPSMGVTAPGIQAGGAFAPTLPVFPGAAGQQASVQPRQSLGGRSGKSRGQASSAAGSPVSRATSTQGADSPTSKRGWTVIWVSDQAFKPAAAPQKTQLEGLGCQVKGYKTQKNAARALDKKRAVAKTVMLVSAAEAASLMTYLQSRPELGTIPVVILANGRTAVNKYEGPHCAIAENFEIAMARVLQVAADLGYH